MRVHRTHCLTVLIIAAALISGCQKTRTGEETERESPGTPEAAVKITEVELGRSVNSASRVDQPTDEFSPSDTIYASVKTENTPAETTIRARWVYTEAGEEQTVAEDTHTTAVEGTGYTHFFIASPNPWPAGSYELRIQIGGASQETARFSVKG